MTNFQDIFKQEELREAPRNYPFLLISIHLGKAQFERTFGTEKDLLKKVKKGLEEKKKMESFLFDVANNTPNEDQFK